MALEDYLLQPNEYGLYGLDIGHATGTQVEIAMSITEGTMGEFFGTALTPTQATERFTWPGWNIWRQGPRPIQLKHDRIITVDLVTTWHEEDKCDCETNTYTGCAYVKNADAGIIEVYDECWAVDCCACCCTCEEAFMTDITYTYGFTASDLASDTFEGRLIRFWIARWGQEVLDALTGHESAVTQAGPSRWASMNYSEQYALVRQTIFGDSPLANAMTKQLKALNIKRAMKFGGRR